MIHEEKTNENFHEKLKVKLPKYALWMWNFNCSLVPSWKEKTLKWFSSHGFLLEFENDEQLEFEHEKTNDKSNDKSNERR